MTTPHRDISDLRSEMPASNTSRTVEVSLVQLSFDQLGVEVGRMQGQLSDLQNKIAAMKEQLTAAAAETVARIPDAETGVIAAPAIIVPRNLERNRKVSGTQLIYMGTLEDPRVGRPLNIFTSDKDFGVMTANDGMAQLGNAKGWEGYDGLPLGKGHGYEKRLFEAWSDGSGLDKWVVPPMVVLTGRNYPGADKIFGGNLFDNRGEGDLKGTLNTSGSVDASWYWSCTESRDSPDLVWLVRFSDGIGGWIHRDYDRSSVRPCLAQELNHLTL